MRGLTRREFLTDLAILTAGLVFFGVGVATSKQKHPPEFDPYEFDHEEFFFGYPKVV